MKLLDRWLSRKPQTPKQRVRGFIVFAFDGDSSLEVKLVPPTLVEQADRRLSLEGALIRLARKYPIRLQRVKFVDDDVLRELIGLKYPGEPFAKLELSSGGADFVVVVVGVPQPR